MSFRMLFLRFECSLQCRNSDSSNENTLCTKYDDPYIVIRVRSFPVCLESTSENEIERVAMEYISLLEV